MAGVACLRLTSGAFAPAGWVVDRSGGWRPRLCHGDRRDFQPFTYTSCTLHDSFESYFTVRTRVRLARSTKAHVLSISPSDYRPAGRLLDGYHRGQSGDGSGRVEQAR